MFKELSDVLESLVKTAKPYNIKSVTQLSEELPRLLKERELALTQIANAKDYLTKSGPDDPTRVCFNTLNILEHDDSDDGLGPDDGHHLAEKG